MSDSNVLPLRRPARRRPSPAALGAGGRSASWCSPSGGTAIHAVALGASSREVLISGELDLASVDSLRSAVRAVLAEGAGTLLLDLTQVEFVDVAGLRAVGAIAAGCRALGCEPLLVLRRDGPVLRLCGLLQVLASSAPGPLDGLAVCFAPE